MAFALPDHFPCQKHLCRPISSSRSTPLSHLLVFNNLEKVLALASNQSLSSILHDFSDASSLDDSLSFIVVTVRLPFFDIMAQQNTSNLHGSKKRILRVGIIGCGEIAQVAHISTLNFLSDYFTITYMCDVSPAALALCAAKVAGPVETTDSARVLCSSPNVDCVLICNASPCHPTHAILALQYDKHVLVEKPLAICYRDLDAIAAAEASSHGRVFVGYMRRYAAAFQDMLAELTNLKSEINYVRVRDIIGPNSAFVAQSGTFPKRFADIDTEDSEMLAQVDRDIMEQALKHELGVPITKESVTMLGLLGNLATHDLSAMRELIGVPQSVIGVSLKLPVWSAMFQYPNFTCTYESGFNSVPVFDAHIEVYTPKKLIRLNYDTPYVKGLPTTVTVREQINSPSGEPAYQERTRRTSYEDPYTLEFKEWYDVITTGREPKTGVADARQDLDIFKMLMQKYFGTASPHSRAI